MNVFSVFRKTSARAPSLYALPSRLNVINSDTWPVVVVVVVGVVSCRVQLLVLVTSLRSVILCARGA